MYLPHLRITGKKPTNSVILLTIVHRINNLYKYGKSLWMYLSKFTITEEKEKKIVIKL